MKITAFVGVTENTDLAVSEDDQLLLITKSGNQKTIVTIGKMSRHTFRDMEVGLNALKSFIVPDVPLKSAIFHEVAENQGIDIIDLPLSKG